ncbi:MAG: threonine--tRNA ligase [Candidatus Nanosyncoccaceae bacterium]|jgi:threonyl-tRNA synthetase
MKQKQQELEQMRHSLAHIMAAAISELWPNTQFGVGPAVDNGFYYDVYIDNQTLGEVDMTQIEKRMRKIISQKIPFIRREVSIKEAIKWAKQAGQHLKIELLDDLSQFGTTEYGARQDDKVNEISSVVLYQLGDFVDLCRGPHVEDSSKVGAFKLTRISGAFWRGDETKQQMQRIYGVAFATQAELDQYLKQQEEARLRDHRKLGQELELFTTSELVGSGLPMFTPRGTILREKLAGLTNQERERVGFQKVWTPHISKNDLYKKSGHWDKFGDELFLVKSQETSDQFVLKPMNCPHHAQIYAALPRSYRDLPVRYIETTTDYRDEKSGELGGLSRVRALTQDDSHNFCRPDQIGEEVNNLINVARSVYGTFGMDLRARLSYRDDGDAYLGSKDLWESSQAMIKEMASANNLDFYEAEGEAAFYGPKIDFMAKDALGREHQVATVQLDFVQPERFGLEYTDKDGAVQRPVMIHCAILGSIERFLSVFIEHTAGWFPFWCAPEQVRVLTVNDSVGEYVREIVEKIESIVLDKPLAFNKLRYSVDDRNESLGKKIREATKMKIPVQLIIGPKDQESYMVSVRTKDKEEKVPFDRITGFLESLV